VAIERGTYLDHCRLRAEAFAALDVGEAELDTLRRAILETNASRPGLDACAFQQHLVSCGLAATVERVLAPPVDRAVDTGFLVPLKDSACARESGRM
jgi:hypothetical protein